MSEPVLWHFSFANYSEKARWALDYKGVAWQGRRPPVPGLHSLWTRRAGGGDTIPVLVFDDGEVCSDTVQIVQALERRYPDPPLYPDDADDRERALEFERRLTDEFGHDVRKLAMDHVRRHPGFAVRMMVPGLPRVIEGPAGLLTSPFQRYLRHYFDVTEATVERAWRRLNGMIDRWEAELGPEGYLAGDRFSVADLTFAALLVPTIQPPGFPYPAHDDRLRAVPEIRELLEERGVLEWVEGLYARHRGERVRVSRAGAAPAGR